MKRVLITGATGFIGSYICRHLVRQGYQLTVTKRPASRLGLLQDVKERIDFIDLDLEDLALLESLVSSSDIIIHCAALLTITSNSDRDILDFNIGRTADLINLALEHQIKKFVFISSVASLSPLKPDSIISEEDADRHEEIKTAYGVSKLMAEREVFRGKAEGLNVIIMQPSFVLGSGYWKEGTPSFFDKIYSGVPFYPPGSNGVVDVRDVARAVGHAIEYEGDYDRFIISAENHTMKSIFDMTCDALGVKRVENKMNYLLGWTGIIFDKLRSVITGSNRLISRDTLYTSSQKYQYDNNRSIEELGMEYNSISDTINEVCSDYLKCISSNETFSFLAFRKELLS